MLSDADIKRELGKNLLIYPLNSQNIKGSSINLTASRLAWSLTTKKTIVSGNTITIPPHDTGLIETEEIVAITGRLAGTYHSRVQTVSAGTGHIGTTMNPGWIGHSLIAIHNHTRQPVNIQVGSPFVTLMLYYLNRKTKIQEDNPSGRSDILQGFSLSDDEKAWIYEDPAKDNRKILAERMRNQPEFSQLTHSEKRKKIISVGILLAIFALLCCALIFVPTGHAAARILDCVFGAYVVLLIAEIYRAIRPSS